LPGQREEALPSLRQKFNLAAGGFRREIEQKRLVGSQFSLAQIEIEREGDASVIHHPGLRVVQGYVNSTSFTRAGKHQPGAISIH
jgi:hypothetical protein